MDSIAIQPPLGGEWKFLRPPGHHPFAFDFVQMDEQRKSYHNAAQIRYLVNGIPASGYYCWDKPVYAPVGGQVIHVGQGRPDNKFCNIWKTIQLWYNATYRFRPKVENGWLDLRPNAGNYVMIQAEAGYIVFLAHLRDQSLLVDEGARVQAGDPVGTVGNSGNSTMPHLHINLFDQMEDPLKAEVLPFVFTHYEALTDQGRWQANDLALPAVGTFLRF